MSYITNRLVVDGLTAKEQKQVDRMWSLLVERTPGNKTRTSYYEFKHKLERYSKIVPPEYHHFSAVLGWTGKAVDALGRRCNWENFSWYGGDVDDLGYAEMFEENTLKTQVRSSIFGSLVHGTGFLISDPVLRDREDTTNIVYGDAFSTTGVWNAQGNALELALSVNEFHKTNENDPSSRTRPKSFTIYTTDTLIEVEQSPGGGSYRIAGEWEHPYGMPVEPFVYKPMLNPFGASRITPAMMGLQDRGVMALTRLEAHMDIYAIPDFWLLGAGMEIFAGADGSVNPWKVMMGRIKAIPDDDELLEMGAEYSAAARPQVQQFPAATPEPHLAAINTFAKLFAREADLPDASLAITDVGNPTSADSYVESREAIISEAEGAMDDWTLPLRRTIVRGLAIQNDDPSLLAELNSFEAEWRSPVYLSRAAAADAGSKQLSSGPEWLKNTEVGLELLGLTPKQVRRALLEKEKAMEEVPATTQVQLNSDDQDTSGMENDNGEQPAAV